MEWLTVFGIGLAGALATALAGLAIAILTRHLKKLGVDVTEAEEAQLTRIVREAIRAVEEQARRTPLSSADKSIIAVDLIRGQRPDLEIADLRLVLDATLAETRPTFVPLTPRAFGTAKSLPPKP